MAEAWSCVISQRTPTTTCETGGIALTRAEGLEGRVNAPHGSEEPHVHCITRSGLVQEFPPSEADGSLATIVSGARGDSRGHIPHALKSGGLSLARRQSRLRDNRRYDSRPGNVYRRIRISRGEQADISCATVCDRVRPCATVCDRVRPVSCFSGNVVFDTIYTI